MLANAPDVDRSTRTNRPLPPHMMGRKRSVLAGVGLGGRCPTSTACSREEPFAPSKSLLDWWRRPGVRTSEDEEVYESEYLPKLEAAGVEEIDAQLKKKVANSSDTVILLCHEEPGQFCHRRLFARWWEEKTGQEIPEL
jgi:hypothetical protein